MDHQEDEYPKTVYVYKSKPVICNKIVKAILFPAAPKAPPRAKAAPVHSTRKVWNYMRFENCVCHPDAKKLYENFYQNLDKSALTRGRIHNQGFYEKVFELYMATETDILPDSDDSDDLDDEAPTKEWYIRAPNADHALLEFTSTTFALKTAYGNPKHWKDMKKPIDTLHSDWKHLERNWTKSGEHRNLDGVVDGLLKDVDEQNPKKRFEIHQKSMNAFYYYLLIKETQGLFERVQAILDKSLQFIRLWKD